MLMMLAVVALAALPSAAQDKPSAPAKPSTASRSAAAPATAPVNLNTATLEQLQTLPGIGVKAAERILEYRQKNGNFKKPEDLMNVKGIGEKSFLKLKPLVVVSEPDKGKP
jgi:competence protein ComEA